MTSTALDTTARKTAARKGLIIAAIEHFEADEDVQRRVKVAANTSGALNEREAQISARTAIMACYLTDKPVEAAVAALLSYAFGAPEFDGTDRNSVSVTFMGE